MMLKKRLTYLLIGMMVLLLAACEAAVEETPVVETPVVDPGVPPAAQMAQQWLAQRFDVPVETVEIVEAQPMEWPDACLGLAQPGEVCAQVITPGWQIIAQVNEEQFEVRTDETGAVIRSPQVMDEVVIPSDPEAVNLSNTQWQLVSFGPPGAETPVVEGTTVTLEFDAAGLAGGSGGCNSYGAPYEVQNNTLSFGDIVSTLIACEEEGVMEQEQQYFQALDTAGAFELTLDRLIIYYADGQGVLNFTPTS